MSSTLSRNIINLRELHNWTQRDLAKRLNMDNSALSRIEKGTRSVSSSELSTMASVFGVTTDYLLGRKKPSNTTTKVNEVDLESDPVILSYGGRPISDEDMSIIKAILKRHQEKKGDK